MISMPASARLALFAALATPVILLTASCRDAHDPHAGHDHAHEKTASAPTKHAHEHIPPHGGTPVVLGNEVFHLEFVRDPARGVLQAYILDSHMEQFIRSAMPSFQVVATVGGEKRPLLFKPVIDPATGEKPGDASLFEAEAEWLKTTPAFDASIVAIDIRGATFAEVPFKFPAGS